MSPPLYLNTIYSTLTFFGIILVLIPLQWHWQAWNTGTCLFMIWSSLLSLVFFINSILWRDNAINLAPVYCDITTTFQTAALFGYSASFLVINRRLYLIATAKVVRITKADRRRAIYVDLAIGLGIPLLLTILHYVGQGHRFNIIENIGCMPTTYMTSLSFVLSVIFPILVVLVSAVYSMLAVRSFLRIRRQFAELSSYHINLSSSRYVRLIFLSIFNIAIDLGIRLFQFGLTVEGPIFPWLGWADTHHHFSLIVGEPALFWRDGSFNEASWELSRWIIPFLSFAFFGFFGFADEAIRTYRSAINVVTGSLGLQKTSTSSSIFSSWRAKESLSNDTTSSVSIAVRGKVMRHSKQNSMASFTDVSSADTASLHSEKEPIESSAEKGVLAPGPLAYDELSLCDVGGTLSDAKP